jgi:hypothetical protein
MERCIGCDEDLHMFFLCVGCLMTCRSSLGKRGWKHMCGLHLFLVVLFEYRVAISKVKVQGLASIGCTW